MNLSSQIVIEVINLSKHYYLQPHQQRHLAGNEVFHALKDVSFQMHRGETLGIIGNNGSGKSTLLRILSQITKPSSGEVVFYGSTTSILEIGTNFHPDLTGRENVLLQLKLAIGNPSDINFLESKILEFSEIGAFYDQPIKYYSSGMFLRLAFSLAFHISSDILILDEVLSVGDEGFRLKCFELLRLLSQQGRTILFVSHNRLEILELSTRCIWLDKGEIKRDGVSSTVLSEYFAMHRDNYDGQKLVVAIDEATTIEKQDSYGAVNLHWNEETAPGNEIMSIRQLSVQSYSGTDKLSHLTPIRIKFVIQKKMPGIHIGAFFFVQDVFYQPVLVGHFLNNSKRRDLSLQLKNEVGLIEITCVIPANFLIPGKYYLLPRFGMEENDWNITSEEAFRFSEKLHFTVEEEPGYKDLIGDMSKGSVRPPLDWEITKLN